MEMLSLQFERQQDVPLYEQLYAHMKNEIIEGRIPFQTKLPSKRKLASFLQLSQTTIEMAYQQLVAEGYIEAVPRKGFFVLSFEELAYVKTEETQPASKKNEPSYRYSFHPSQIDTTPFPFNRWRKHAKDLIDERYQHLLTLGEAQGDAVLRNEIASYLYHSRGVRCDADQIIVGSGTEHLLPQVLLLLGRDARYGIEDPGYHLTRRIIQAHELTAYPIPVDRKGVNVKALSNTDATVMYVTPAHQFPTGTILSVNRRTQLLNWAAENDARYIIEDDYDSEFRYSGKPIPSLQSLDQGENVIYLSTFSKSLMPSLRIGYMVLPKSLLKPYRTMFNGYTSSVSRIDQHILARFMEEGDFERHLNRMRKLYKRKLEIVMDVLNDYPASISVFGESAGLHIVLTVQAGLTEQELIERAEQASIQLFGLSYYAREPIAGPPNIVLGFARLAEEEIQPAVEALLDSWGVVK